MTLIDNIVKISIPNFPNCYACSNGKIWSANKNKYLSGEIDKDGYIKVHLSYNGRTQKFFVHRLIAEAFISNPNHLPQVNHKNEIKNDNRPENLEWVTCKENINYGTCISRRAKTKSKPLIMCDIQTHQPIKQFNSRTEANQFLGVIDKGNIKLVIDGKRQSAYGYWWKEENN